jgi:hypothetical protein
LELGCFRFCALRDLPDGLEKPAEIRKARIVADGEFNDHILPRVESRSWDLVEEIELPDWEVRVGNILGTSTITAT